MGNTKVFSLEKLRYHLLNDRLVIEAMSHRKIAPSCKLITKSQTVFMAALAALLFVTSNESSALPYHDGVVSVADREFFVGQLTDSFGDDARSFKFRHAPWLKAILDNDPMLSDQDVRFLRSGVPASELIGELPSQLRELERLEDDPLYMAEGHDVITFGNLDLDIYPTSSSVNYSVSCTRGFEKGELNICGVRVAYPYATNVVLTARKYFPGRLPEISDDFERIAARMVEIAVCLDVTDRNDAERPISETELLEENPDLSDCSILLSS